jgi:hypothetical protein
MQPLSENQRPDILTSLITMSFVLRLPRDMHLCRSSNGPRLPPFLEMLQNPHVLLTFDKVHNPMRLPRERTSERPEMVRTCPNMWRFQQFGLEKCFATTARTISTSQLPKVVRTGCFLKFFEHFTLETRFAPKRRALFRHVNFNFQKWSDTEVFRTF